ncbi:hypothetical protein [Mucilaginibacter panaciglaebae]|uniref:Lipocalin-like domain-containing protein n=1 Tax=Mucilaginibacter panaciglaebae TaxID=502331 RepID=A0ABP7WEA0_9SPHI
MKKIPAGTFMLLLVGLIGCHKNQVDPSQRSTSTEKPPVINIGHTGSIAGKWYIDTVTTLFYDATGLRNSGNHAYPYFGDYYFLFNTDSSWVESLSSVPDSLRNEGMVSEGTYWLTSDSTFTLIYPKASPGRINEACQILYFSNKLFIFSKQLPTIYNGVDTGHIKYVFRLYK